MKLGQLWRSTEIAEIVGGDPSPNAKEVVVEHLSWDTRRLGGERRSLFIALRAQRDGHEFLSDALRRGAVLALVEKPPSVPIPYILVSDTWQALFRWASTWRSRLDYPILAIAGSVGKTWIKEWLAYLLEGERRTYRSPGSFNSQLGVPLSLLSFPLKGDLGIVEAGISAPGDMAPLAQLIRPQYGILSPIGRGHDEAFPNFEAKLREKLSLFHQAEWIIALHQPETQAYLKELPHVQLAGFSSTSRFIWERIGPSEGLWHVSEKDKYPIRLPADSLPVWQNALLAAAAAYTLGLSISHLQERLPTLPAIQSRLQWIQDGSGRLWLNDTYHADASSVAVAIEELRTIPLQPKAAVLTDFSPYTVESHEAALQSLREFLPIDHIHLIGEVFQKVGHEPAYPSVEAFLRTARLPQRGAILLKGSRRFRLEEALKRLMGYGPAPELHVDWEKVYHNLLYLRARLSRQTRIMGILKAEAYGSGDLLMASFLERQGIAYIGVAYTREAIRLREAGIRTPILVFYPGEVPHSVFLDYGLEAAVGTLRALEYWAGKVPLHLEFDTGMGRMGLMPTQLPEILNRLRGSVVRGVFTHLAEAAHPEHPLTKQQLTLFSEIYHAVKAAFPEALGHVLNTAGILSMGEKAAYDMVRVGIGLYGIGKGLQEATRLWAPILRIAPIPPKQRLNYGFSSEVPDGYEVATVAIGYGDGLPRSWAERGARVFLHGEPCPILPPLNMDLTLIAVPTGLAQVGDKVEIWGHHRSLACLAQEAQTIPYELLARLSPRVYRLYSWGA
ncbi:MAG: alanine racemase [Bacteroidia bacterium]|nr:alanine racemase [Bacteroidia bacterium]